MIANFRGDNTTPGVGGLLRQDNDLDGDSSDGDGGLEVPINMTNYNFPLASTGDEIQVRVRFHGSGSEELAFDNICITGTDVEAPVAALADPADGGSIVSAVLNLRGYVDVIFADNSGFDPATVTDASAEFSFSGTGAGTASPSGLAVLQSGTTYRYTFSGAFTPGTVSVDFVSDSFADLAGNANVADSDSFTTLNSPPDADPDTVARYPTSSLKIPVGTLLDGDTDPEGNLPLTVTGVTYTGGNGATLTLSGDTVFYNPNGHQGTDTFTYTVEDSLGASSTGSVSIGLITSDAESSNLITMETLGDGSKKLTFGGIPGRTYRVQSTDSLTPTNWVDRMTVPATSLGRIVFTDDDLPLPPQRFYRTVHP